MKKDINLLIGTVNGSGSQSANSILLKSLFNMGVPVGGKNIFPSNIAGLATWFSIRANRDGFVSFAESYDIVVCFNPETFEQDIKKVKSSGLVLYPKGRQYDSEKIPQDVISYAIDFKTLVADLSKSIQVKKLLMNMVYVGVLAEVLGVSEKSLIQALKSQLKGKENLFSINESALEKGRQWVKDLGITLPQFSVDAKGLSAMEDKVLLDGNRAGALGLVSAGATFASWYPITPSSSLAENFQDFCFQFRQNENGEHQYAILQSEDELSAIAMVAGAGWAGARAFTATSGPGVSLMAECIGLMYFAEIPGVIWNVQRMGPSTGLPTRTSQGDLMACAYASHGDSRHPVLIPGTPAECFEMAHDAFDLAEGFQSLVFVLSDLDLGMNSWMSDRPKAHTKKLDRGKVLNAKDLEKVKDYARYGDRDGDGIPHRTLPGTPHDGAAYFTRGTGHTPEAKYSEDAENYRQLLNRLDRKWETLKTKVPKPVIVKRNPKVGILYFGSTVAIMGELTHLLSSDGHSFSECRIRAFPFSNEVDDFINEHEKIIVIEQNQMAQMKSLLTMEYPAQAHKLTGITEYGGMPLGAQAVYKKIGKLSEEDRNVFN